MSIHQSFRRQPVPQQVAQQATALTIPAPTRGIIESENRAFMRPGGALICDNWAPTMRGVKLRGGCVRWCVLPETTPIISAFEYASGNVEKMFAANASKLYEVTTSVPAVVKTGQLSGNYAASQLANAGGDYLIAVNDAGDYALRFDGTTWTTLNGGQITGPVGSTVVAGHNLTYVWKYRNRWFFIEGNSMNAWYLGLNSISGALAMIPLSGACSKGGKLIAGFTWSVDAGDGLDDKCVFLSSEGELLIFTGTDPSNASNWRQEGRYAVGKPMGMNAHMAMGGDVMLETVDGIVPLSTVISKDTSQLDLAAITTNIKTMWREEVAKNAGEWPWTMKRWDEYGATFIAWPGGEPGDRYCAIVNNATGAFARFVGYDATCFIRMAANLFFGTQAGIVMRADRGGYDDGQPYVAVLVGAWGTLGSRLAQTTWHQARASFTAAGNEPFIPQLTSAVDYAITLPTPPPAGADPGLAETWDSGLWDHAHWDAAAPGRAAVRNTGWVSIGSTGYIHAPIVQVTVAQLARPQVELIAIDAIYAPPMGTNV